MKISQVIWRLITFRPWVYWTVAGIWILLNLMELIPGLLAKLFFDKLTDSSPVNFSIPTILLLVFIAAVVNSGLLTFGWFVDIRSRCLISLLLRRNLLDELLKQPTAHVTTGAMGEVVTTFREDVDTLEDASDWVIDTISQAIFLPAALLIMIRISPLVTLFTVAPLLFVLVVARVASTKIKKYRRASRKATEQVTAVLGEVLGASQAVQIANAQTHIANHVAQLNDNRREMSVKDSLFTKIIQSVFANSANLGTGLTLIVAADAMRSGQFTVGDFTLFAAYLQVLSVFTSQFGMSLAQFQQAEVSFSRILKLSMGQDEKGDLRKAAETILTHRRVYLQGELPSFSNPKQLPVDRLEKLEVINLSSSYQRATNQGEIGSDQLRNVSFQIERGNFIVITGKVGSGKTTLLRTLLGLLPRRAGEILWNDYVVEKPQRFFLPPRTAYTPQIPKLFSGTVQENILLGVEEQQADLDRAIHHAVLSRDLGEMEAGLHTVIGPKGVRLSGGQIQRTAAARMFMRDAQLLVLDDISSALDLETESQLWSRLFGEYTESLGHPAPTCLVVSHRETALKRADTILYMKDGAIAARGKFDELIDHSPDFRYYWQRSQQG